MGAHITEDRGGETACLCVVARQLCAPWSVKDSRCRTHSANPHTHTTNAQKHTTNWAPHQSPWDYVWFSKVWIVLHFWWLLLWLLKILSHTLQTLTQNTTFGLVQSISHPESLCIKREWFLCIENDANINLVEYLLIITLIMEYK